MIDGFWEMAWIDMGVSFYKLYGKRLFRQVE
jgi:hypothetical protein